MYSISKEDALQIHEALMEAVIRSQMPTTMPLNRAISLIRNAMEWGVTQDELESARKPWCYNCRLGGHGYCDGDKLVIRTGRPCQCEHTYKVI